MTMTGADEPVSSTLKPGGSGPQVKIIYSAPGFFVPSPADVSEKLKDKSNIIYRQGGLIVKVTPETVVKFGSHITVHEAKNMIYVATNTTIPVPKVFAYYTYGPIDRDIEDYGSLFDTYIFMSLVEGQTLDTVWDSYSESTKTRISAQLKMYLQDLRNVRGNDESSYIGSVDRGPVTDQILSNYHVKG